MEDEDDDDDDEEEERHDRRELQEAATNAGESEGRAEKYGASFSIPRAVGYFVDRMNEGRRRATRRRRQTPRRPPASEAPKTASDYLQEVAEGVRALDLRGMPARLLGAVRSEMQSARRLARRGVRRRRDGSRVLPEFGITGYPRVIYLLRTLPQNHLAYHTVVLAAIVVLSFFRFCIAWLLFVFVIVEGYSIYFMARKLVCDKLRLPYREPVDPAFILTPEMETVGWINMLLRGLWRTCLREFVRRDLRTALNHVLRNKSKEWKKKNSFLSRLRPRVLEMDIGPEAPKVTGVKTYASEINLLNSSDDSLTLDVGVIFHVKPGVLASLNRNFSFGLHELQLDAPMRFRFVPLLRDRTFFGEVQFSFLLSPIVDFELSGILGFLSLSMVKPVVLYSVHEAFKYVLYPHKIIIPNPLVDNFKQHTLTISKPLGLLRVNLKEGTNLEPNDMPVCCVFVAQSDPYVLLRLGPRAEKTPVIKKNMSPRWNHICEFPITQQDVDFRELKLSVLDFDWGFWKEDEPLGFTTISVAQVYKRKQVDEWYRLGEGGDGTLHLFIQFVPLESAKIPESPRIPADPRVSQAILVILLYEVQMSHLCKPMIVFEVSGRPPATSTPGQLSENWEFAEEFLFPIHNVRTDKVTISLVDYNAKVTVRAVTGRMCQSMKDFIADADDPTVVKEYQRERHYLLSEKTMDVEGSDGFTGYKQQINLESGEGGIYHVILIGRLHYLKNQEYEQRTAFEPIDMDRKGAIGDT